MSDRLSQRVLTPSFHMQEDSESKEGVIRAESQHPRKALTKGISQSQASYLMTSKDNYWGCIQVFPPEALGVEGKGETRNLLDSFCELGSDAGGSQKVWTEDSQTLRQQGSCQQCRLLWCPAQGSRPVCGHWWGRGPDLARLSAVFTVKVSPSYSHLEAFQIAYSTVSPLYGNPLQFYMAECKEEQTELDNKLRQRRKAFSLSSSCHLL